MAGAGTPEARFALALYQDTQGSTAVLVNAAGRLVGRSYAMLTQHRPQLGWVEYDPYEIWHRSWQAVDQACKAAGIAIENLAAFGVTTQRGTVLLWERATGRPLSPAVSWRCMRTAPMCQELRAAGHAELFRQRTGGFLDHTMAGPKIQWLLNNLPDLRGRADQGEVCCGTVDSWLLWNLTGGAVHATDRTNASSTLLFNLHTGDWDDELLELLHIPRAILPQVQASGAPYGKLAAWKTPITAVCADQQAGLFGQACFAPGMVKVTCGRRAVVMVGVDRPLDTAGQLCTRAAPTLDGEPPAFALEGQILSAGLAIEWLRDELALIPTAADSDLMAQQTRSSDGVYVVPALQGLGAPYWDLDVRGSISGLTPTTSRAQLVRATLEGVAYRVRDIVEAMTHWAEQEASEVRIDGGAAANNFLLQSLTDVLGISVRRGRATDAAAPGVAYLAGLQAGLWSSREQITQNWPEERLFEPSVDEKSRQLLYQGWREAVQRLLSTRAETDLASEA